MATFQSPEINVRGRSARPRRRSVRTDSAYAMGRSRMRQAGPASGDRHDHAAPARARGTWPLLSESGSVRQRRPRRNGARVAPIRGVCLRQPTWPQPAESRSPASGGRDASNSSRAAQIGAAETAARRPMRNRGRRPARLPALAERQSVASRSLPWRPFYRWSLFVPSGMWSTESSARIVPERAPWRVRLTSPQRAFNWAVLSGRARGPTWPPGLPGWTFQKCTCPSTRKYRSPSCSYVCAPLTSSPAGMKVAYVFSTLRPHGQLQAREDDPSAAGAGNAWRRGRRNVLL
jgi:hypothetical protein